MLLVKGYSSRVGAVARSWQPTPIAAGAAQWGGIRVGHSQHLLPELLTPRGICIPHRWPNPGVDVLSWRTLANLGSQSFAWLYAVLSPLWTHILKFLFSLPLRELLNSKYWCLWIYHCILQQCIQKIAQICLSLLKPLFGWLRGRVGSINSKVNPDYFAMKYLLVIHSLM